MSSSISGPVSAQVILRTPSQQDAQSAMQFFAVAGFSVGSFFGNSFSITANAEQFEKFFKVRFQRTSGGGIQVRSPSGSATEEFPVDSLPLAVRRQVSTVTFTKPPDFGPTQFG